MKYLMALLLALLVPTAAIAKGECKETSRSFARTLSKRRETSALASTSMADLSEACKTMLEAKAKKRTPRVSQNG